MRIIKQQNVLQRQSENYIKGELSNVAMVLQTPQILCTYYSIDADLSPTMTGFKNVADFIHPESHVVYNRIENLPISGVDSLVTQASFDEELGYDEDLQSSAVILPNTIVPKPNDCIIFNNSEVTALFVVTSTSPVTVRSNPFTEISFRLFSRDPEIIKQLERQVKDDYITTVTAIGQDKTLVIKKESYFTIQDHIKNYLDLASLYATLFFDKTRSAFIFDGIYDESREEKMEFLDLVLWKFMFDEGIIIYDDVVTYAINNLDLKTERIYTSYPPDYVTDHLYKKSIIYRLFVRDPKRKFDEFKYPQSVDPDPRLGKFTGRNLLYFEFYGNTCDCNAMCLTCPVWDEEFTNRIRDGVPYNADYFTGTCNGCNRRCEGKQLVPYNPYLRNVIINWYNHTEIDWENLEISDSKTCENYFLIPLVLAAYKRYIHDLQK